MISHITLKNYKSIVNADVELSHLNVLIGKNGTGKSNFLNFFDVLSQGAEKKLSSAMNLMGGFPQVIHYATSRDAALEWEITFTNINSEDEIYYTVKLNSRGTYSYSITLEEVSRPPYPNRIGRYKYLSASDGRVRILKSREDKEEPASEESDQELVIAQKIDRTRYPAMYEIQNLLSQWTIFRGFGKDALDNIRGPQLLNPPDPLRLDPLGVNLVSILQQLKNQPQLRSIETALNNTLSAVFEDYDGLDIPIVAGGTGSLNYRSKYFNVPIPALSMSDGQLRFIGLVLLLLLPDPPSLITIDEPEVGLHPEMLPVLAELLKQASERTQIIVATHSPQLIDFIKPQDVLTIERANGATHIERLPVERLERWLERYSLGKLWTLGKLEA
jgi:predicted ATPase